MLRGVLVAIIVCIVVIGILYIEGPVYTQKTVTDPLQHALDQVQSGLTYDKFVNMVGAQRDAIVEKMPQKTIDLIMDEAKKTPTRVSETLQDMISKVSPDSQSVTFSKQGQFVGLQGHDAQGKAEIISVGKISFLRFENFEVTNGPDLHVYMTVDGNVTSGIDLGRLKGSTGDQNYALDNIDIKTYNVVIISSQPFNIYFAEAKLS